MKKCFAMLLCLLLVISSQIPSMAESKGDTAKLQLYLMRYGFYSMKVDGDYGNGTKRAVSDFQNANGLTATGEADEDTKKLLFDGKPVSNQPDFELRNGITWGMIGEELDDAMAAEGISSHEDMSVGWITFRVYRKVPVSDYKVTMACWMLGDFGLQAVFYATIPNSALKGSALIEDSDNLKLLLEMKYGKADYDNWEWTDSDFSYIFTDEDGAAMGYYTRIVDWDLDGVMLQLCVNSDMEDYGLARKPTAWIGYYNEFFLNVMDIMDSVTDDDILQVIYECMGVEVEEPNMNGL